ncbi:molybdate ABC transporter substrate-binding protein [Niveibacterium terrae]|uniref:molybdate ABC transporter substrate-binding protein n=1 Tax=Niveibacterium terrae TaxID=3373598 RepID=UPI003A913DBE
MKLNQLITLFGFLCLAEASAAEVHVAVAANFAGPIEKIAAAFERDTGHKLSVAVGSTGKFYAQIHAGAPFEVLLAADDETPKKLVGEGIAIAASEFTYARGTLVLWSAKPGLIDAHGAVLKNGTYAHLAICNPKLAPYGLAAVETMKALGLYESLKPKLVEAENIAQTYQFTATGNAELGFVALSQVIPLGSKTHYWVVPENLHTPIQQDAVLLKKGEANPAAAAFLKYLRGEAARAVILSYGYRI